MANNKNNSSDFSPVAIVLDEIGCPQHLVQQLVETFAKYEYYSLQDLMLYPLSAYQLMNYFPAVVFLRFNEKQLDWLGQMTKKVQQFTFMARALFV